MSTSSVARAQSGDEHSRAVLVPPRPNLGPEPPGERMSLSGAVLLAGLLSALVLFLLARRRTRARPREQSSRIGSALPIDLDSRTPLERFRAWSEAIREALAVRLGPAWRAKTTEEMAMDEALPALVGFARAEALIRFFKTADQVKFAAVVPDQSDECGPWVVAFVADVSAAGASSTIIGK